MRRLLSVAALLGCHGGATKDAVDLGPCTPRSGTQPTVREITHVDDLPLLVTSPPAPDARLFIVERAGTIAVYADGQLQHAPFLDLTNGPVVSLGDEQGLLGLAFHPGYAQNRKFYVYYTTDTDDVVAEYQAMANDPTRADPATARIVLSIPDYATNHNGGMIEFGADGFLYIGTGDGGGQGDPNNNGQNPSSLLGKFLRIDVDVASGHGIPTDNPFVAGGGAPEVFMIGLRNPWRWSFDRGTGNIYIGDVGQSSVEEVDVVNAASAALTDFGWSDCEGRLPYKGAGCDSPTQPHRVPPAYQQIRAAGGGTSNWTSVVGGQVYRGACYPDLVGRYFFSDNNASGLYSFVWDGAQATDVIVHPGDFPAGPTSIHADSRGELYITYADQRVMHLEVE